jgi:hypothetical protein
VNTDTIEVKSPFAPDPRITTTARVDGMPVASELIAAPVSTVQAVPPAVEEGAEGETDVWETRYSLRNFVGRFVVRCVLSVAWGVLAIETWANQHEDWAVATVILGILLGLSWLGLLLRVAQARIGHHYRLTNRRLFVSTGVFRRRHDQMELLRVKDVFVRQSMTEGWMSLGTVVVVPNERDLPVFYLTGIENPNQVMDTVWGRARAERDDRAERVEQV